MVQVEVVVTAAAGLARGEGQGARGLAQLFHRLPHTGEGSTHAAARPSTATPAFKRTPASTLPYHIWE